MSLGNGIKLAAGFDLNASIPLDSRMVAVNQTERDAIPAINRYDGLICYVVFDGKNYQLVGGTANTNWIELQGSLLSSGVVSINTTGAGNVVDFKVNGTTVASIDSAGNYIKTGLTTLNALTVTGATSLNTLSVSGNASLHGTLSLDKDLTVGLTTTLTGAATFNGGATASTLTVTNGTNLNTLTVSGTTSLQGLNVNGAASLASTLDVTGALHAKSTLTVDSTTTLTGAVTASSTIHSVGALTADNNITMAANDGNGIQLWASDNYKIYMSSQSNATYGGRLDSTSDYNMYFKMVGGTNRGFVFRNDTVPIAQIEGTGLIKTIGNNLLFNSGTSGVPSKNASIEIARGSSTNASLLWDEAADAWKAGIKGLEKAIVYTDDSRLTGLSGTGTIDWANITSKPTSSVASIDNAVSVSHTQNTDTTLTGAGANTINTTGAGNIINFKVNGAIKSSIDKNGNFTGYAYATQLTFSQATPILNWTITHNLNKIPTVIVLDTDGYLMEADIKYIDNNNVMLVFGDLFSGNAYIS